ncbi:hypothetical protein CsSME_00051408 [Camellia sinensis var. sinensis]
MNAQSTTVQLQPRPQSKPRVQCMASSNKTYSYNSQIFDDHSKIFEALSMANSSSPLIPFNLSLLISNLSSFVNVKLENLILIKVDLLDEEVFKVLYSPEEADISEVLVEEEGKIFTILIKFLNHLVFLLKLVLVLELYVRTKLPRKSCIKVFILKSSLLVSSSVTSSVPTAQSISVAPIVSPSIPSVVLSSAKPMPSSVVPSSVAPIHSSAAHISATPTTPIPPDLISSSSSLSQSIYISSLYIHLPIYLPTAPPCSTINSHSMITRSTSTSLHSLVHLAHVPTKPNSYKEAAQSPDWTKAMVEKFQAFQSQQTESLVDLPSNKNVIGYK